MVALSFDDGPHPTFTLEVLEVLHRHDAKATFFLIGERSEVVLLTGHYSAESAVEAIQKGASDYLTKPVQGDKLQERVASLLAELRKRQRCLELENALLDTYQNCAAGELQTEGNSSGLGCLEKVGAYP